MGSLRGEFRAVVRRGWGSAIDSRLKAGIPKRGKGKGPAFV